MIDLVVVFVLMAISALGGAVWQDRWFKSIYEFVDEDEDIDDLWDDEVLQRVTAIRTALVHIDDYFDFGGSERAAQLRNEIDAQLSALVGEDSDAWDETEDSSASSGE